MKFRSLVGAIIVGFALCGISEKSLLAHEGHDHGAPPPPVSSTIAPRTDASSSDFELVAIARGEGLRIYLDSFRGNDPIRDAIIEVDGPNGTVKAATVDEGAYVIEAPWISKAGTYDLAFTVQSKDIVDVLTASLVIPQLAPQASENMSLIGSLINQLYASPHGTVNKAHFNINWLVVILSFSAGVIVTWFVKRKKDVTGALMGWVVISLFSASTVDAASVVKPIAERDVAQRFADGALFVPKTTQRILGVRTVVTQIDTYAGSVELAGRVIPDPTTTGYVQASVAGRLMPPPGGFPRLGTEVKAGDILALVQPAIGAADITTQQQQARELDQQIAIVERRLERFQQIQGVVARAQIEDAQLELQGLRIRRANLEKSPREPEALVAPVSGVIAASQAIAGQIADPNAIVFQIIDPRRFWVEALSFEAMPLEKAAFGRLSDQKTVPLTFRGSGLADRNQAIPVQFSIEQSDKGLRAGQLLTVLATTQDEKTGIALPRTSILRGPNGQAIVYEHTNAERFVPREVRVEPLDGNRVLVVSGLEPGKRIVTQGAELLNQIR